MMRHEKLLAIAASSGKVGFVYLSGEELLDWGLSAKASRNVDAAFLEATRLLRYYRPYRVILEAVDGGTRKGRHTRALIAALSAAATELQVRVEFVGRRLRYPNKYVAAARLAEEYPQLEPWLPAPRKIWEHEPRKIILFEALGLATAWREAMNRRD